MDPAAGSLGGSHPSTQTLPGHSLTCCSSNSVENRWVTDRISLEKEKEPPPYLGEQRGELSRGLRAAQAGGRDGAPSPGAQAAHRCPQPLCPPPAPMWCSLAKKKLPVAADEVPGQGLPHHVAGDAVDGGGGILLADLGGVDGVLQVPGGGSHRVRGCASRALALAPAPAPTAGGSRAQCCRREPRGSCRPRTQRGPPGTFPTRSSRPPDRPWPPRCSRWRSAGSGGCCRGKRRLRQGALAVPSPAVGAPQGLTCCCRCSASVGTDWWPAPGTQGCRRSRLC